MMVVLLLLNCKKRLENLKFIHLASTFALKAVSSTTEKINNRINVVDNFGDETFPFHNSLLREGKKSPDKS